MTKPVVNIGTTNETRELLTFEFSQNKSPVRSLLVSGIPWMVAKDICDVLEIKNASMAVKQLDDDERAKKNLGRQGKTWLVNESGMYALILRSNKPQARAFRKWVTNEVLPAIRKSGSYTKARHEANFVEARQQPFGITNLNGHNVRYVQLKGVQWYNLNDVLISMGVRTESHQTARKLNRVTELAIKIWVYGNNRPAWFTTKEGVQMVVNSSRKFTGQLVLQYVKSELS